MDIEDRIGTASVCFGHGSQSMWRHPSRRVRTSSSKARSSVRPTSRRTAKARKQRPASRRFGAFVPMSSVSSIVANRNPRRPLRFQPLRQTRLRSEPVHQRVPVYPEPFLFCSALVRNRLNLHKRVAAKLKWSWTRRSWNIRKTAQERFERGDTVLKGCYL